MKPEESPPRLIDSPELGEVIERAATRRWDPARVARNQEAIQTKIAGLSATGSAGMGATSVVKGTAVAKWMVPVALTITAGVVAIRWSDSASTPEAGSTAAAEQGPPIVLERTPDSAVSPEPTKVVEPAVVVPKAPVPPQASSPTPPEAPAASTLPEQLRLFARATAAADRSDYAAAQQALDLLETRFPETTLRAEIWLARADVLSRSGDGEAALRFIESIQDRPVVAGKKAQLLRLAADIWLREGDCTKAVSAYQRALGLGLDDAEASAARAGLRQCVGR